MKHIWKLLALLLIVGCANVEKNAYRTLGVLGATENTAVRIFKDFDKTGQATDAQEAIIRDTHEKFSRCYIVAVDALAEYHNAKVKDRSWLDSAIEAVQSSWKDVTNLILTFLPPDKSAKLKEAIGK